MIAWAVIAAVDPTLLAAAAEAAWGRISDGGEPPAMHARRLADGTGALTGDEPGLTGMLDRWAGATAARLGLAVQVLDLDPDADERHQATPAGAVTTSDGARTHAQQVGLVPTPRAKNRSVVIVDGAAPEAVAAAVLAALRIAALPPKFRITAHPRGTLVMDAPASLGPSTLARLLTELGPVWTFVWGPTTNDLLVKWTVAGRAGHVRWPAGTGEGARPAELAELDAAAVVRHFGLTDPAAT